MPTISVIIPAYNRASLIGDTLRSLVAQTLPANEIIVVDDGSVDNTASVAESFGPPVRVIRQPNGGPGAARNAGFKVSKGDFIHFFDSDDLAVPNKHELQVRALEQSGADIAISPWVKGRFAGSRFDADNNVFQQRGIPNGPDLVKPLLTHWSIVPHSMLFRRSVVERCGAFDQSYLVAEDQMMFLRCLLEGARVVHVPGTLMLYRLGNGGKITENKTWAARKLQDWGRFLLAAREACLAAGTDPLRWSGYRQRLWETVQDLRNNQAVDAALMSKLERHGLAGGARLAYSCQRVFNRWRGGLQQRLTGGRAHAFFKIGKVSETQLNLIAKLGYVYGQPARWPWVYAA